MGGRSETHLHLHLHGHHAGALASPVRPDLLPPALLRDPPTSASPGASQLWACPQGAREGPSVGQAPSLGQPLGDQRSNPNPPGTVVQPLPFPKPVCSSAKWGSPHPHVLVCCPLPCPCCPGSLLTLLSCSSQLALSAWLRGPSVGESSRWRLAWRPQPSLDLGLPVLCPLDPGPSWGPCLSQLRGGSELRGLNWG